MMPDMYINIGTFPSLNHHMAILFPQFSKITLFLFMKLGILFVAREPSVYPLRVKA
jgi:hypothetical protein